MAAKRSAGSSTAKHAARVARDRVDVRKRVHDLTVEAFRDRKLKVDQLPDLMEEVLEGAAAGLDDAMPGNRKSVLRQVVGGLSDAFSAVGHAAKETFKGATKRGQRFAKHEVAKVVDDLSGLEDGFVDSVGSFSSKLGHELKGEVDSILSEGKKAGKKIGPSVRGAVSAANGHLAELAEEAASTGVRAARGTVRGIMLGASGLLAGLSDALEDRAGSSHRTTKAAPKPAAKKKTSKKSGKKASRR
jgi:hypothetical protein